MYRESTRSLINTVTHSEIEPEIRSSAAALPTGDIDIEEHRAQVACRPSRTRPEWMARTASSSQLESNKAMFSRGWGQSCTVAQDWSRRMNGVVLAKELRVNCRIWRIRANPNTPMPPIPKNRRIGNGGTEMGLWAVRHSIRCKQFDGTQLVSSGVCVQLQRAVYKLQLEQRQAQLTVIRRNITMRTATLVLVIACIGYIGALGNFGIPTKNKDINLVFNVDISVDYSKGNKTNDTCLTVSIPIRNNTNNNSSIDSPKTQDDVYKTNQTTTNSTAS
ncbi:unnamed protein product [Spodoptera exigua]|nr:unnamed protein product [Spodoptera exigua]